MIRITFVVVIIYIYIFVFQYDYPVFVQVFDVNDNAPVFGGTPYSATVNEVRFYS